MGYKRLTQHNIVGRGIEFEPLDEIHYWHPTPYTLKDVGATKEFVNSVYIVEMTGLEKNLIDFHQPQLNCNEMGEHRTIQKCKRCEKEYPANRSWQEFCSKKCREANWRDKPKEEKTTMKVCGYCKEQYNIHVIHLSCQNAFLCPKCRGGTFDIETFKLIPYEEPKSIG